MKKILILMTLMILTSSVSALTASSIATDNYINEKAKFANTQDWRNYDDLYGNFYVILDGEPYLVQISNGKVVEVKAGTPVSYDYKIVTTTKTADKWWEVATYYFEHGEFSNTQRYIVIPWLYLTTCIEIEGRENFACQVVGAYESSINII